jgi:hypothetical protein
MSRAFDLVEYQIYSPSSLSVLAETMLARARFHTNGTYYSHFCYSKPAHACALSECLVTTRALVEVAENWRVDRRNTLE